MIFLDTVSSWFPGFGAEIHNISGNAIFQVGIPVFEQNLDGIHTTF